jgi:hypothetical protein
LGCEGSKDLAYHYVSQNSTCQSVEWVWSKILQHFIWLLNDNIFNFKSVVFMAVMIKIVALWVVTPCSLVSRSRCSRETCCLHLQSSSV